MSGGSSVGGRKTRVLFTSVFVFCTIISAWRCIYVGSEESFSPLASWTSVAASDKLFKDDEFRRLGSDHQHTSNTKDASRNDNSISSAAELPQTIDAWVAEILTPNQPLPLASTKPRKYPRIRWGKNFAHYKMHGVNYEMSSPSSRLQRLPMLEPFVSQIEDPRKGRRFPSNPALAAHPIRHRLDGPTSAHYALAIQLGSGSFTRRTNTIAKYSQDRGRWLVSTVWLDMSVNQLGPDDFALSYTGTSERVGSIVGQDMRLTEYEGYDDTDSQPTTMLGWGCVHTKAMNALRFTHASSPEGKDLSLSMLAKGDRFSKMQKNWIPILDDAPDGVPKWITHYSPFIVVDCGPLPDPGSRGHDVSCRPLRPEMDQANPTSFEQYSTWCLARLPAGSEHWRGSAPLVRLPSNRRLALGTVHQRGYTKDGVFFDAYRHRFVLIDLDSTMIIAYTDEFAIFASIDQVDWFEFLTGCTLYKEKEVLLSFGYNDQEPWLAILPLEGILQWLIPVEPKWESLVDQVRGPHRFPRATSPRGRFIPRP